MFAAQAHSFLQQARLAVTLAWVAGYTNVLTLIAFGTVTSHMTGTVSHLGQDVAERRWGVGLFFAYLFITFIAGAGLSAVTAETGRRRGWESIYILPMTLEAVLLAILAVGLAAHEPGSAVGIGFTYGMTGLASLAMGLQNATITRISGGVVRTTHMTGVVTDLGMEGVQFLYVLHDRRKKHVPLLGALAQPTSKRLGLLLSVIGSFALGAGLGAACFDWQPRFAMFIPVLFLLGIVYQDIKAPICDIEPSGLTGPEHGFNLPPQIALYHLRPDPHRDGPVHRLPDLLRWCERLPSEKTVVILDLSEARDLDTNAALELRALIKQAGNRGRRIILAGISAAQYKDLREHGAADALDPMNVCSDLELAMARALTFVKS